MLKTILALNLATLASSLPALPAKNPPNGFGANFSFPLADGFPNVTATTIARLEKQAGGRIPQSLPGPNPGPAGILEFQIVVYEEESEAAFFAELLHNVTNGVPGYTPADYPGISPEYLMDTLTAVLAQEQIHALTAQAAVVGYGAAPIGPCRYTFPVTNFEESMLFAQTFTDNVLGALAGVEQLAAETADPALATIMATIIAQEGQQSGFWRYAQGKIASAAPFDTESNAIFLYNHILQTVAVPGSCAQYLDVPVFGKLNLLSTPKTRNSTLTFSIANSTIPTNSYITYLSGATLPLTVPITGISTKGQTTHFKASFPFDILSHGLTLAALTTGSGPFANATAVSDVTTFGPAVIELL